VVRGRQASSLSHPINLPDSEPPLLVYKWWVSNNLEKEISLDVDENESVVLVQTKYDKFLREKSI
jgi:hypothetical protein